MAVMICAQKENKSCCYKNNHGSLKLIEVMNIV